ncbi:hypothetical protein DM02DRAFT_660514 [Periconia macrospinosa]|uniref:Diphthamide biosynthesis protein 4 n=1 Tax=Periconia macrospinosa TaxID=97972 RepID=A0A2V1DAA3_9PLEO|nr:hypothetical protein DM02DRAFT_660514 [Periconia macrospinosa]
MEPPYKSKHKKTADYYTILNLSVYRPSLSPSSFVLGGGGTTSAKISNNDDDDDNGRRNLDLLTVDVVKKAYRDMLLRVHPDKNVVRSRLTTTTEDGEEGEQGKRKRKSDDGTDVTIDDIKLAYAILSSPTKRKEYDEWLISHPTPTTNDDDAENENTHVVVVDESFVSALDTLDLSDFTTAVLDEPFSSFSGYAALGSNPPSPSTTHQLQPQPQPQGEGERESEVEGQGEIQWTTPCHRCGADPGFVVREKELEDAEARGEGEVLVGCRGCSLWVRVEFGVVEEG